MNETHYFSKGRRIIVSRLRSARVIRLGEDRKAIAVPGWHPFPLGNERFQLLLRADVIPANRLRVFRLEELTESLRAAEETIGDRPLSEEERSLRDEVGTTGIPVLLGRDGGLLMPTGEVIARFHANMTRGAIESELQRHGGRMVRPVEFLPNTYVLEPFDGADGLDLANGLVDADLVDFASPNFIEEMPFRSVDPPPNNLFSQQWHLDNVGQNGARANADVSALEAWEITTGSPDVTICIIDSGVDSNHEAFGNGKLVPGFDFQDQDPIPDPTTSAHGTSCAGVAAAPWGIGRVVGIAPDCRIMPIRRATLSEHLKMAEAFAWAVNHGADVISCSFGYDHRPWILPDVVNAALDYAVNDGRDGRGCVIVWAAGNGNESISTDEWASDEKVIAVGASTDRDVRAPYSDKGPELDVCAPSSGGNNGVTTTSIGGYTSHFGGTSSAAPLVAGIVGLLLSANPNLHRDEIHEILRLSADRIDLERGGYDVTGHSDLYGFGRVNAIQALHHIPVLNEAVRGSDVEPRLPTIRRFSEQSLAPHSAGQEILQFLESRKFRILELLVSSSDFRQHIVVVLRATADISDALEMGSEIVVSDTAWNSVGAVAPLLLA